MRISRGRRSPLTPGTLLQPKLSVCPKQRSLHQIVLHAGCSRGLAGPPVSTDCHHQVKKLHTDVDVRVPNLTSIYRVLSGI
ncbi:hypothetical protein COCON_G00179720 [Conger conger]|uniref:Uncharacterized protein n=1 Tax=Conger conger TaxID=82655 RepID=A0A9Q1D4Z1_CONCO|nr:hypothetical protein COCON_G00179720 [Conger conger]